MNTLFVYTAVVADIIYLDWIKLDTLLISQIVATSQVLANG